MLSNGRYMTSADFKQYSDSLIEQLNTLHRINNDETIANIDSVKNVTFVLTENCNLACTYCYEKHKTNKKMTKEIGKAAVDFLFDKEKINGYYDLDSVEGIVLDFIGGEPLLETEVMDYIVEYFKAKAYNMNHPWATNYMISISSNGTLYFDDKFQNFLKKNKNKVSISITIDGNKRLHDSCRLFHDGKGSYDIVERAIKDLISKGGSDQTKITLAPANVMYLNEALQNVYGLGIRGAYTNCVYEEGWTIEHARILYQEMIKLSNYMLEDKRYEKYFCSLFDESIGKKLENDDNWCFKAGTMILTPNGYRPIEKLSKGDYVISHDHSVQPINKVVKRLARDTAIIEAENINTIYTTLNHPFLVLKDKEEVPKWYDVSDIEVGDKLVMFDELSSQKFPYKYIKVTKINKKCEPYYVYNIGVSNTHTYIANRVVVHNCGGNGRMLAIGTDGKCYPCIRFMNYALSEDGREEQPIGDIFNGLEDKNKNKFLKVLCSITMSSQSDDECNSCTCASGCSLCTGYNYDKFGTPNKRAKYICLMHKARVLANYYYFNKLYELLGIDESFKCNIKEEDILEITGLNKKDFIDTIRK